MSLNTPRSACHRFVPAALLGALALAACSDGTSDDPQATAGAPGVAGVPSAEPVDGEGAEVATTESHERAARFGQIVISETLTEQGEAVSRVAGRFVALTEQAMTNTGMLERAVDTCDRVPGQASVPGHDDADGARPAGADLLFPAGLLAGELDAGQAIVLSSPDGTWSTLMPKALGTARVYLQDSNGSRIDGRIPSGLVLDIPDGGDFPAFAAIALPDPQPGADSFVPGIGSPTDLTTEFRWASNNATGSRVHLAFEDADGRIDCFAADDGLFTLTDASPGSALPNGNATLAGVAREATRIERGADATLVLTVATQRP